MRAALSILFLFIFSFFSFSQINVDNNYPYNSPQYLVNDVLVGANCINTSNITFQGDPMQIGYFSNALSTNLNIDDGLILSTGDVNIIDPTFSNYVFQPPNLVSDPDLLNVANEVPPLLPAPHTNSFTVSSINDVAILEFDFVPNTSILTFDYVFGSLEYFQFENTEFNDVFGFFISGPGITGPYSSPSYHPNGSMNLAHVPLFSPDLPITVSSVNDTTPFNSQYFIDNRTTQNLISEVGGHTTVFTANATLVPGQTYHIRLAIADGSDNNYNSFIWLDGGSFSSSDFSPSVSSTISDNTCSSPTDLTINVSQDPNEEDIDFATFTSNKGSFDLAAILVGDVIGSATLNFTINSNTFNTDLIVSNIISGSEIEVQAIDNSNGLVLGEFILKNLPTGGVEIFADSPTDGNNTTGGNSSTVTFNNIFINPSSSSLYFYYNLTSELLCTYNDNEYFNIVNCITFSPSCSVGLSDYNCQASTDLTINVSQNYNEEDIDYATFTSDVGSFDFTSLVVGDIIGQATMILSLNSFTADIIVNSISLNEIIVQAIDQNTGANLGDFTLENLSGGGVEIFVNSPIDGNYYTNGNSSSITFFNIFQNPSSSSINFNFSFTSELGATYSNSYNISIVCCPSFSPIINYYLADLICVTTDLTINVSQDCNEEDISNISITSNTGSFSLSTINIGDNIGNANLNYSSGNFNTNLIVSSFVSLTEIIVDVIDQVSGNTLSTINIENLFPAGIEITSLDLLNDSPGDGDNYTTYLNASINFYNVFVNPDNSIVLNFNTQITSELSSNYSSDNNFNITCLPDLYLSFSYPSCFGYNDGSFELNGSGGTGTYNYQLQIYDPILSQWIPIGQSPLAGNYTIHTVSFNNLFAGCYRISITDDAGNVTEENICLYEPDDIMAYELITHVTPGLNNDGSIEIINSTGGIRPFTYSWTGPNSFTAITENVFNLEAGTYYLTIIDGNNCTQTFIYIIDLLIPGCMDIIANNYDPNASFDDGSCCYLNFYNDSIILCLGDSVELLYSNLGGNADSYLWSTGDVSSSLYVDPILASTYFLEIIYNGNVCRDSIAVTISCLSFSPSVAVTLSNLNCALTDLTINISQDPNEIDMDSAVFISDAGSFLISTISVGDNIGFASMDIGFVSISTDLIVSNIISSSQIQVEAINQISGLVLGTFLIKNRSSGGIEIIATSPGDGNSYTLNGNSSSVTFVNIFDSPDTGFLNFTSSIYSELGDNDIQYFPFILNCTDFSPSVSVLLSSFNCNSLSDLTINISQDPFEVDMDTATFISDGGYFIISSMSVGDVIGSAIMSLNLNTFNTDLIVNSILSNSEIIVEAIDQLTGVVLGTFTITNLIGGGVEINAVSPNDGNSYTNGNNSTIIFSNIFHNPSSSSLIFTSNITSEFDTLYQNISPFVLNCSISPTVLISLSDYNCVLTDLTIIVSQDNNEVDIDTAIFISDAGSFILSSLNIGDNIGVATMILSLNTFNTDLIVNSIVSSSEIIVQSVDQLTGAILGTFTVLNLPGSGVRIVAISPDDGNSFTSGHLSTITFNNIFLSPNTGFINFTSEIISETGDIDIQNFLLILNCTDFSPTFTVSLSDLNCGVLAALTISISQDSNEVDMDTALFTSNAGSFTISSMSTGDNIGTASMILGLNTYNTNLIVNSFVSSSQIIVEAVDQITGVVIGSFTITNLIGGGTEILAISPDDGNLFTNGNSSVISFTNVFTISSSGPLSFTSNILSELGDIDIQSSSFTIGSVSSYFTIVSCDSYLWNGSIFGSSGIYVDTMSNVLGCDSIVTLNLTINDSYSGSLDVTSCDDFTWDGVVYNSTGAYINIYTRINGCDSTITLNLTINNSYSRTIDITACDNFTWDGFVYDSTGLYTNTYFDINGCDSTLTLNLTINDSYSGSVDITACDDFLWDLVVYDSTGSYTNFYTDLNGCDSIVTLILTINNSSSSFDTVAVCYNYLWNGILYDSSGVYVDTILNNVGCDSVILLNLSINSNFSNNVITACNSFLWNGVIYDSTGIYIDTLINTFLCDSIVSIDLTIDSSSLSIDSVIVCDSYLWNGETYDTSGVYYLGGRVNNYAMSFDGINDNVILDPTPAFGPTTTSDFTISIWVNPNISHSGMIVSQYENTIPNNSNYFLSINSSNSFRISGNATNYYDFGLVNIGTWQYVSLVFHSSGLVETYINGIASGSSTLNLLNTISSMPLQIGDFLTGGCTGCIGPFSGKLDNIDIWNTSLSQQEIQDNMLCSPVGNENNLVGYWNFEEGVGTTAYDLTSNLNDGVINGAIYNSDAPNQSCSLNSINGCDSIAALFLTVNYTLSVIDTIIACDSLLWNGSNYFNSGIYIDTLISSTSCDSIVTIDLTIINSSSSSNVITACNSYIWNGITFSSSGIYDTILVNIAGCDSFTEIYLTIIPSVYYNLSIHSCGNFNWNGNILNTSGIYIDTLISSTNCDSIVTLELLITDDIRIVPTLFNVSCYGESTGQINLNINAGSPPFTFQWSNGAITEDIFNLLGDSIYSCSIIDSSGCILDTNFFISQPSILNVIENINNISCYGGNDGSIVLNINGGVVPYITNWGAIDTFNLVSGYYNYFVTDSNGCFVNDSVEVTQENPILIDILTENIQCFGQSTGSIDINVLSGSGVPGYSYEWIGPNLFSSTFADINNLFAGNYFLTIIDANLCQLDTIITLTQPINIAQNTDIQTSDFNGFNIRCKGDNSGWVSVLVSGGYEPYSYSWSNLSTSDSIYDLIAGTYILEVTDSLGCIIVFDFPLIEPSEVLSSTILPTTDYNGYNISCYGFNDGAILGLANGGVPDYTYYWNSILSIDSISDLFVGDYELTVYDKNNCVSSSNITIIEPDSLYLIVDQYTDTCFKGVGSAEVNVFGGVTAYSFLWSNGSLLPIISDFSQGTYQVIVNDANFCQIEGSATILNLPSPIIDFEIYPNNQRLFDQFDDPLIFIDYTDGIWQDIISWNWDYDDGSFGIDSISYHSYSETGNYMVILTTISEYNCVDTLSKLAIITDYNLFIPNAFTPFSSDDELNNIFKPYGTGIISYEMEIFSRWGEMLFSSDNLDFGWDGTSSKGNQVPVGIYIYVIEAENVYGETFKYNGQVKLIR
tara:strand:- start:18444 stop:27773 length:9330 start_codon:yes stop_codon:yes gene_type:complete